MSDRDAIRRWVVQEGLDGSAVSTLLSGLAERLFAAGLPVWRAHISFPTISPRLRARNIVWRADGGLREESVDHERFEGAYAESPFPAMMAVGLRTKRWRLRHEADTEGYGLLRELLALGASDHIVHLTSFEGGPSAAMLGVSLSFTTRASTGFAEDEAALLAELVPPTALAAFRMILSELAVDVLGAYLGRDAGQHVLGGAIRPGEGHEVGAALMFADLRGFTAATEAAGAAILPRLGEHLSAMAEPVEAAGGEVLKFLGDGLLAAFPANLPAGPEAACRAALDAACEALRRNALVNEGWPEALGLDIALHLGDVFYGNIGAGSRLDFTVIGPAVNVASRIEHLCGVLGHNILMSDVFAAHCGRPTRSLGRHPIRGLTDTREILTVVSDPRTA